MVRKGYKSLCNSLDEESELPNEEALLYREKASKVKLCLKQYLRFRYEKPSIFGFTSASLRYNRLV